jgi:hypothetical protein
VAVGLVFAGQARADPTDPPALFSGAPARDPWRIDWLPAGEVPDLVGRPLSLDLPTGFNQTTATQPLHAAAIEHSHAFEVRSKIHKIASLATLPLFGVQLALGQSLYNGTGNGDAKKGAHAVVGAGIVGLFGVNTLTGAWNLFGVEGRRDRGGRTLRLVHGLLMMAADVGFVATSLSTPDSEGRRSGAFEDNRATHRNLAIASISVGSAGYLLMLLGNR